jgi:hypothetical protein
MGLFGDSLRFGLFCASLYMAVQIRLYAVNTYGRIIHEFDPWFNYRATEYMVAHGWDKFQVRLARERRCRRAAYAPRPRPCHALAHSATARPLPPPHTHAGARLTTTTAKEDLFIVSFVVATTNSVDDYSLGITTHLLMPLPQSAHARAHARTRADPRGRRHRPSRNTHPHNRQARTHSRRAPTPAPPPAPPSAGLV